LTGLARKNPRTGRVRSLREIARELEALGKVTRSGKPYAAGSVAWMLRDKTTPAKSPTAA